MLMKRSKGKPSLKGKDPPCSLWQDRPGADQAPLDSDPIESWNDDHDDENKPVKASKRRKRNVRGALLGRSFRNYCSNIFEATFECSFLEKVYCKHSQMSIEPSAMDSNTNSDVCFDIPQNNTTGNTCTMCLNVCV